MPTIVIRDPTLLERLKRIKPVPAEDYYDDVIYELLRRAERAESKPKLSGLDNLPQLILKEIKKALDGQLAELVKSAILPAVSNLSLEVPVELSIRVRLKLEPVLELSHGSTHNNHGEDPPAAGGKPADPFARTAELDELERRAIEFLKQQGGCWKGSPYSLAKLIAGRRDAGLEERIRRHTVTKYGWVCLPEAAKEDEVVVE